MAYRYDPAQLAFLVEHGDALARLIAREDWKTTITITGDTNGYRIGLDSTRVVDSDRHHAHVVRRADEDRDFGGIIEMIRIAAKHHNRRLDELNAVG